MATDWLQIQAAENPAVVPLDFTTVAENPVASQKCDALQQDSRLQSAIQELVHPRVLTLQIEKPEKPN